MSKKSNIHPYQTFLAFTILSLITLTHSSIHDLMRSRGLPPGLFPKNIKSYHLNNDDLLEVHMIEPCLAKFESRVFYDTVVRANLSYGGLIGVQGLSQEDLFLWFSIKEIIVNDPSSGLIVFDIGLAYKQFAYSSFEEPPFCVPTGQISIKDVGIRAKPEIKLSSDI